MSLIETRPRRRRRGESWDLWQVISPGGTATGLLVTSQPSGLKAPKLIAFVEGIGQASLRKALAIRRDPRRAALALDLRGACAKQFPAWLLWLLLLPVDSLGRVIRNHQTFESGRYAYASMRHVKTGIVTRGLEFGLRIRTRPPKEKSGSPAAHRPYASKQRG